MTQLSASQWPVDGHVHFHRKELVGPTLDAAAANFARLRGTDSGLLGALLLSQTRTEKVFEQLTPGSSAGGWRFAAVAGELQTLLATKGPASIAVVCGRQLRARAGLEVAAMGTTAEFPDGRELRESVELVLAAGALAALPWGFGKWTGARLATVEQTLREVGAQQLAVGDNGVRLQLLPAAPLLRNSAGNGLRVLRGTDPFPFGGDHRRVGSFGFAAHIDAAAPWRSLRAAIEGGQPSPPLFGRALGPVRFVAQQIGIQIYTRMKRSAAA